MHWLDSVLAVPTIGVRAAPDIAFAIQLPAAASPLADRLSKSGELASATQTEPGAAQFQTKDGRIFAVDRETFSVQFGYTLAVRKRAGALPELAPMEVRVYSEVLAQVRAGVSATLETLWGNERRLNRIGVVASVRLRVDEPPPGVAKLLELLGSPWQGRLLKCDSTLLAELADSPSKQDKCHHRIVFDITPSQEEEGARELTLMLDWQRSLKEERALRASAVMSEVDRAVEDAMTYFERVGEGIVE